MSVRGKLTESVKRGYLVTTERYAGTSTTDYWMGISATTSAVMIDTQGFDDFDAVLLPGTLLGEAVTVENEVYHSTTNNPMAASQVTGASFTDIVTTNDETMREGSVLCKDQNRYFGLHTKIITSGSLPYTFDFAAMYAMGRPESQPTVKTLDFDV